MRRPARILLNALTVVSLLLFLASVALCLRSRWALEGVSFRTPVRGDGAAAAANPRVHELWAYATRDALMLEYSVCIFEPRDPAEAQSLRRDLPATTTFRHRSFKPRPLADWAGGSSYGGFTFERYDSRDEPPDIKKTEEVAGVAYQARIVGTTAAAPWWLLLSLFAIPPLVAARRAWRSHRNPTPGLCAGCGYDLRATPERCPECGAIPGR